jgi:hypothetical protein
MARRCSEYGVPSTIVGRLVVTNPGGMYLLTAADLQQMNVSITN